MDGVGEVLFQGFDWLLLVERELLLFAAFWFAVGLIDEFALDCAWIGLRLTGQAKTARLSAGYGAAPLAGPIAVMIPACQEAEVIATTMRHALAAWPQADLWLYIGCYRNDPATLEAALSGAGEDSRVRLVIHDAHGPTTKADCLNRLYRALECDEARSGTRFRGIILHDAEDMVHSAALQAIDAALGHFDFVQLPVRPTPNPDSRWIAGHYADEFAEAHAKAMVVRSALRAALPAAGVGCGFARDALAALAERRRGAGAAGPFAPECLTEDYELGLELSRSGRGSRFLRLRDAEGRLIATGSHFPSRLDTAVRQKTRWVHGIAFQGWDRMGWTWRPLELWMALRDRRGPLTALVLAVAYVLLVVDGVLLAAGALGWTGGVPLGPTTKALLWLSFGGFVWRTALRAAFTGREYGVAEGLRAVLRIPLGNIVAIMAGRRALAAYFATLRGAPVVWDKTVHDSHPAAVLREVRA